MGSQSNIIYNNNFIDNATQADDNGSNNKFYLDLPTGGNYWSDYTGVDDGSDGRVAGDGIGDTLLLHLGLDNYPWIQEQSGWSGPPLPQPPTPEEAILETRRVLRSRSEFAVCIVPRDSSWGEEYMKKAKAGHIFYRHARFYNVSELEDMLRRCSFKVVTKKTTLSYPPSANPRIEEPSENLEGKGFVCLKAVETQQDSSTPFSIDRRQKTFGSDF